MKAIVMAGGEGTRLRPLTCGVPKPMVTLLDKPILEYTVELLARHGIRDMAFTLMYKPSVIIDYFKDYADANIEYFIEDEPLGTAGSVKNASGFVTGSPKSEAFRGDVTGSQKSEVFRGDVMGSPKSEAFRGDDSGTFIIISGDALCDIDLTDALRYHRNSGAAATIVLKKMGSPLDYGVVISGGDGSVERFVEKPGWEDVFSDTINTGLYILEQEVLDLIPEARQFDFAKDLFPLMLEREIPMVGYLAKGYWCDVGNIESYVKAHEDILKGAVDVHIKGTCAAGIYVGEGADISSSSLIQAPCYIGEGAFIGEGASIGAYSSIGSGVRIGSRSNIKRSVVHEGARIGRNTKLSSCVIGRGSTLGERCSVYEGGVVGDRCTLAGDNIVSPHVKIWPEKWLSAGISANENIVWGFGERAGFLGKNGFVGDIGADITPLRLGRIFGAAAEYMSGKSVAVSSDGTAFGDAVMKQAVGVFTQSGVDVYTLRGALKPVCAQVAALLGAGLCVSVKSQKRIKLYADLFEPDIFILSKETRKKIEGKYFAQGENLADRSCGKETHVGAAETLYINTVYNSIDTASIKNTSLGILVRGGKEVDAFAARVFKECGLKVVRQQEDLAVPVADLLKDEDLDFAVRISRNATFGSLYLPDGRVLGEGDFETIAYYLIFSDVDNSSVKLPSGVSRSVSSMADIMGMKYSYVSEQEALRSISRDNRRMLFDGVFAVCRLAEHIARTGISLDEIAAMIEPEHRRVREISCGWDDIGRVIKTVYQQGGAHAAEGLRLDEENGYGYICPHSTHPKIIVRTEGFTEEYAEELCEKYTDMVRKIIKG